jgi:CBS domain-containing protein
VHSLSPDAPLSEVCDYFTKGLIHRVLVTDREELVGIVTTSDLVGVLKTFLAGKVPEKVQA